MKKRILSLVLLTSILMSFAACSETTVTETKTENETPSTETAVADTTETETVTEDEEITPDLPDADYNGYEYTFLTSGQNDTNGVDWVTYDVYVDELNGDVINDAVYERNLYIEETYNAIIKDVKCSSTTMAETKTAVKSGDDTYDTVMTNLNAAALLGQGGNTYNLYDIPHIDLTKPWWDQRAVKDLTLFNRLHYATGDITIIDNDATWTLMFNKELLENFGIESPYTCVREDRWTYDVLKKMIAQGTSDVNGDGVMKALDDIFGIATTIDTCQGLFYASGVKLATVDADGSPVTNLTDELIPTVAMYAGEMLADTNQVFICDRTGYSTANTTKLFESGGALFYGEVMQCVTRMRESETDFGILPWPKFTETQDSYYNFVHATAGKCITIPVTQKNTDMAGVIIEAMAYKSMSTLTSAYYDVALTFKYTRDEDSKEMLDIIFDTRCFDIGYVYDWGTMLSTVKQCIYTGGQDISSKLAKIQKVTDKAIDKTTKEYMAVIEAQK